MDAAENLGRCAGAPPRDTCHHNVRDPQGGWAATGQRARRQLVPRQPLGSRKHRGPRIQLASLRPAPSSLKPALAEDHHPHPSPGPTSWLRVYRGSSPGPRLQARSSFPRIPLPTPRPSSDSGFVWRLDESLLGRRVETAHPHGHPTLVPSTVHARRTLGRAVSSSSSTQDDLRSPGPEFTASPRGRGRGLAVPRQTHGRPPRGCALSLPAPLGKGARLSLLQLEPLG